MLLNVISLKWEVCVCVCGGGGGVEYFITECVLTLWIYNAFKQKRPNCAI